MAARVAQLKGELVDRAADIVRKKVRGGDAAAAEAFVRLFYRDVPPQDIAEQSPEVLYAAALSFWRFGARRPVGQAVVRVFNPRLEEHGYRCRHTVVEIVNDNMPFLVDSTAALLNRHNLTVHHLFHPVVKTARGEDGKVTEVAAPNGSAAGTESYVHVEIDEQPDGAALETLKTAVENMMLDVRAAVEDWPQMREEIAAMAKRLDDVPAGYDARDAEEAQAFLNWMLDNNFTILGTRHYRYEGENGGSRLRVAPDGLGLLRSPDRMVMENWLDNEPLPPELQAFVAQPALTMITKANESSTVHRPVRFDVIGIKTFDDKGNSDGEDLILGLFTSGAYSRSPEAIPLLRKKVETVMWRAGFTPASHDHKALAHILDSYPRDELLQIDTDNLYDNAIGILHLQERQRIAMFLRQDPFERFVSALVYVPRDNYSEALGKNLGDILGRSFGGTVTAFTPSLASDSVLARLHYVVKTEPGSLPAFDAKDIEAALVAAARSWSDRLHDALVEAKGEDVGVRLFYRYKDAFGTGYRDRYSPDEAVADIALAEAALTDGDNSGLAINLYRAIESGDDELRLKLAHAESALALSDILPMLENMGLKVVGEELHEVRLAGGDAAPEGPVWLHDFELVSRSGGLADLGAVKGKFHDTFARVFSGAVENDGFNRLVLQAGLDWREVVIVRCMCKFLRQAGIAFSQSYMEQTLSANAEIATLLVGMFRAKFAPSGEDVADVGKIKSDIEARLEAVANLDEDRILRHFLNVVDATLRTNYFKRDDTGSAPSYLSIKLDSRRVEALPEPRPLMEIFVYSARMEGCHLRGGKVARGGIRWSDRREDFRTEILGLVKAQMVKNAVIVPVGSKGGFVCKKLPAGGDRQAVMDEVIACYCTLICGMLDITDNLVDGKVAAPTDVKRYDEDDPYLVVAADKGTATFSDIANGISQRYGFWLGDAFASGGSAGYDHKKMGITARGAWESVKRHFRELGTNIQEEPFTVIGVGDMSGDVFGNGMLLSRQIRLQAAFNHMHIFVDPDPDPATSYKERERLFGLPRSAWSDYNAKLISAGGGVFERSAKSVDISPEMQAAFGISEDKMTPNALIRALLLAKADLLWFGGIGTYVKAAAESDSDAGDRANDAVRVDAEALNVRVVGEGANLGITQRARMAFAAKDGLLNTDFIDNSAGVDASDHEVNIKIVLDGVVANGDLTEKQRNSLLESMTDDVARLVLNDNYLQSQAISLACGQADDLLEQQWRLMRGLERSGRLNRPIEFLPNDEEMAERQSAREGLTRPEYAVLFSYAKLALYDDLLETPLPDSPYLTRDIARYFPRDLRQTYEAQIGAHRLRREIIATYLVNSLINRMGATFVNELQARTGRPPADIAASYVVARDAFGLRPLWRAIEALDNKVDNAVQAEMFLALMRLVERGTLWLIENLPQPLDMSAMVSRYGEGIEVLATDMADVVGADQKKAMAARAKRLTGQGVPKDLAARAAALEPLASACDVVRIGEACGQGVADTARVYYHLGATLGIDWLRDAVAGVKADSEWEKLALRAIVDDSYAHQSGLAARVLKEGDADGLAGAKAAAAQKLVDGWLAGRQQVVERTAGLLAELRSAREIDLAMLTVANRQLATLVRA